MDKINFISQSTSLTLVIIISLLFTLIGVVYSKKYQGINNYLRCANFCVQLDQDYVHMGLALRTDSR